MGVLCSILSTFLQVWNYLKIKVHTGFCFLFFAFASPLKNMHAPRPGIESKSHLWPRPQLQQCQILNLTQSQGLNQHLSSNLSHCRDNSGSLTHCVRTGTPKLYISTSTISILSRPYFIYFWFLLFLGFFIVEIFFFSFPFFTTPKAYGSSWVREWIWATSPTYTTAVATPNSYHIVPQEELIFLLLLRNLISKKLFLFYLGI